MITVKNSSPAGDLLSLLPSLRQLYRSTGKKVIIYQALNVVGQGWQGIAQPYKNEQGESVLMGKETYEMLKPLILSQEYIQDFVPYFGQEITYDLDEMRLKTFCNQPHGSLHRFIWYVFPEMANDLNEQWIYVAGEGDRDKTVILNFTPRYRNNWINYFFLKPYEDRLCFFGIKSEYDDFCKKWDLNIKHIELDDFYHAAALMKNCKFFMGNASALFQIAEGLKIPRLLETCQVIPNVIPFGKNAYDFYHQAAAELYFKQLINQYK